MGIKVIPMSNRKIEYSKETLLIKNKIDKTSKNYDSLTRKIASANSSIKRITKEISNKEAAVIKYQRLIDELPDKISELNNTIPLKKEALQEKEKKLEVLTEKQSDCSSDLIILKKQLNHSITKDYVNLVYELTPENSYHSWLDASTRTTPLMDKLYFDEVNFLCLRILYHGSIHIEGNFISYSFIVVDFSVPGMQYYNYNYTISEIKKNETCLPDIMEEECVKILKCIPFDELKEGDVFPFEIPYSFRAQNFSHQTGFGDYYEWGELVYEGTKYGDTGRHFFIGFKIDDIHKY